MELLDPDAITLILLSDALELLQCIHRQSKQLREKPATNKTTGCLRIDASVRKSSLAPRPRFELGTLRLTALKPNSLQFAGAGRNRRKSASLEKNWDKPVSPSLFSLCSRFVAVHRSLHDTAMTPTHSFPIANDSGVDGDKPVSRYRSAFFVQNRSG